jgi:hypothetical protein
MNAANEPQPRLTIDNIAWRYKAQADRPRYDAVRRHP